MRPLKAVSGRLPDTALQYTQGVQCLSGSGADRTKGPIGHPTFDGWRSPNRHPQAIRDLRIPQHSVGLQVRCGIWKSRSGSEVAIQEIATYRTFHTLILLLIV